jgi:hypothetical protein
VSGNLKLSFFFRLKANQYVSATITHTAKMVIVNATASTVFFEDFPAPQWPSTSLNPSFVGAHKIFKP